MKDLLREARKAARQGDYSRAGDLCDMAGHPLDAVAYYVQGKHYLLAGHVAARIGEYAQAAGYFSSGGDAAQAAEMYVRAGQKKKASMMFERSGQYVKAAEIELRMENYPAAAAFYELGGQIEKAAQLFAQAGDNGHAAALYEKLYKTGAPNPLDLGAFDLAEPHRRNAKYARFAGILYLKAGEWSKAGPFLEEAGLFEQAVQAFRKAGRADRAAALLIKLEDYGEALKLVEEEPGATVDPKLLGELYLRSGRFEKAAEVFLSQGLGFRAAECFESGGDLARAAALFVAEGELIRAGDLYSGIGRHREAARAYEKAGETRNAGRAWEKAGLPEEAVRVFEAAGMVFEAARIHLRRGSKSQAIRALQQVKNDDPDFGKACFELGQLFSEQGLHAPAVEKFEVARRLITDLNEKVKCLYHLALAYEQMGRVEEACRLYEKVLLVDYHHADVADRLKALAQQVSHPPASGTTSQKQAIRDTLRLPSPTPQGIAANISGRLEVTRKLGQGRYAVVLEAYDRALQKKVAAKRYPPASSTEPDMINRFLKEAQRASELSHPCMVNVFGIGEDREGRYILQELVESGRTLREILDEKVRFEPGRVIEFATQICDLLSHAHRKGILHRDLRPENIFILPDDQVKVSDFGLKPRLSDPAATAGHIICYASPESLRSERVDERSDIYAFGIILYEMLLGEPPFPPDTASFDHLNVPPPFPVKVDRMLPGFLRKIIERCLEKDRARRYRSATQVLDELKASAIVPGVIVAERYEIVRELGIGGMGRIYQALDRELDEPVALKVLRSGDAEGRHVERFLREIKMARRITHPNVVKVYDLGSWKEHKYITMEYIEGMNLEQWVRLRSKLDLNEAVTVMVQIARGLEAAHELGIIHRDVKPQNILLKDSVTPKILDFGIARGSESGEMTTAGFVMGSPKYMSPEQVQAMPLDLRSDVYSLGVVLYFVFTGREPFVGDTPSVIAYKHIGEAPRPPRDANPEIPEWLDALIRRTLAKNRDDRFASMGELADALESGLASRASAARPGA